MTINKIKINSEGWITIPDKPELGIEIDKSELDKYIVYTEIKIKGHVKYQSPGF